MRMSLNLINNSDDYLRESLEKAKLANKNPSDWKYAILNIVQAIELSLKERLRIEHKCLIYENIDKQTTTVSIEKAIERLLKIAEINITSSDIENIKLAKNWRNALTHFEFDYDIDALKISYIKLFGFLNDFNENHLGRLLKDVLSKDIWDAITRYYHYTKELSERAKKVIAEKKYKNIIRCCECWEETFIIDNNFNTCLTCKHTESVIECYHCGTFIFESESHKPYLGIITGGNDPDSIGKKFQPTLCEFCYDEYKKEYDL